MEIEMFDATPEEVLASVQKACRLPNLTGAEAVDLHHEVLRILSSLQRIWLLARRYGANEVTKLLCSRCEDEATAKQARAAVQFVGSMR
jgi:hypothetical protein